MGLLEVQDLTVEAGGKVVVDNTSLALEEGEVLYLLGPNGTGKTSLIRSIVGYPGYNIVRGRVLLEGEDLTGKPMEYRVSRGLGLAHQLPPKLSGLRVRALLDAICSRTKCSADEIASALQIQYLLDRDFGRGFSGGELKRVELATLLAMRPKVGLIDEPDSGVDVDSVKVIADGIRALMGVSRSVLIVTHSALISKYIRPTRVCLMLNRRIQYCGGPELVEEVFEHGFKGLVRGDQV